MQHDSWIVYNIRIMYCYLDLLSLRENAVERGNLKFQGTILVKKEILLTSREWAGMTANPCIRLHHGQAVMSRLVQNTTSLIMN